MYADRGSLNDNAILFVPMDAAIAAAPGTPGVDNGIPSAGQPQLVPGICGANSADMNVLRQLVAW